MQYRENSDLGGRYQQSVTVVHLICVQYIYLCVSAEVHVPNYLFILGTQKRCVVSNLINRTTATPLICLELA